MYAVTQSERTGREDAASGRGMTLREAILFAIIGALLALMVNLRSPSPLSNDSYQYLSVASSVLHGKGIETPLIYFDTERSHGRAPAPMTTFAPGFPVVLAMSSVVAPHNPERAARLVSLAASAFSILIIWELAMLAGLSTNMTRAAMALLLLNASFLHTSSAVVSEPLFLLISCSALLLISATDGSIEGRYNLPGILAGHVLVALSYLIRYAGIFVFVSVVLHATARFAIERTRRSFVALLGCVVSGALMSLVMIRNLMLVGTWKGGNDKAVSNPIRGVLADYVRAQIHLLFGNHEMDFLAVSIILVSLAALFGAIVLAVRATPKYSQILPRPLSLFLTYGLVATAALLYLGRSSVISFGPRMFYPLLPLYIVGVLALIERGWTSAGNAPPFSALARVFAAAFIGLYGWVNLREFREPAGQPLSAEIQSFLNEPMADGKPVEDWIAANINSTEVIAADSGQATGYLLNRPVLSLAESHYSSVHWDRDTLITLMRRFHARFLFLYPKLPAELDAAKSESPFLRGAICCRTSPGFHVAAENADVKILELDQ